MKIFEDESGKVSPTKVLSSYVVVALITPLIYLGLWIGKDSSTYVLGALGILSGMVTTLLVGAQARTASVLNAKTNSQAKAKLTPTAGKGK